MKLADGARPPTPLPPLTFAPLPFDQAIAAAARRGVVLPADYYGTLQGLARSQAFTVSGLASLAQIQQLRESLDDAIAGGQTFAQWRKRVLSSGVTALPRHRLENIFRTNIQSSYMRGRGEQMLARVATHPYWMYDAVNDSRTRPAHAAMDGTVLRFDNPWWRTHYPPNGYMCRCAVRALTQAEAERRGITTAPDPDGQPDEGWSYSVLEDAQAGVRQAVVAAQQAAGPLAPALQQALANPPPIPLGPRVSAAIEPKAGKRLYAKVLGIIDALHGDGVLPRISGTNGRGKKTFGTYWATRSGAAGKIDVSSQGKWPELTLAHEIGHFLDHHGIGTAGVYSSRFEPAIMGDVMRALAASDAIKGLLATTPTKYTRYLLQPHEQWARAYAQWVALRSGDSVLRGQLAATLSEANRQWADADFLPIAAAIDRLFKELKWTR